MIAATTSRPGLRYPCARARAAQRRRRTSRRTPARAWPRRRTGDSRAAPGAGQGTRGPTGWARRPARGGASRMVTGARLPSHPRQLATGACSELTSRGGLRMPTSPSTPPSATINADTPMPTRNGRTEDSSVARATLWRTAAGVSAGATRASGCRLASRGRAPDPGEGKRAELRVELGAELRGHDRYRGDRHERGHARDGVVHAGGDAGVALVGVGEHGGRERRHRHRQTEGEHQHRRQDVCRSSPRPRRSAAVAPARLRPSRPTPMKNRGP